MAYCVYEQVDDLYLKIVRARYRATQRVRDTLQRHSATATIVTRRDQPKLMSLSCRSFVTCCVCRTPISRQLMPSLSAADIVSLLPRRFVCSFIDSSILTEQKTSKAKLSNLFVFVAVVSCFTVCCFCLLNAS